VATGGDTRGRPIDFMPMNGPAGARIDLMAMPSVDIANGAPTGKDATNEIVDAWTDGRFGLEGPRACHVPQFRRGRWTLS
jgi:hypothetical protein